MQYIKYSVKATEWRQPCPEKAGLARCTTVYLLLCDAVVVVAVLL